MSSRLLRLAAAVFAALVPLVDASAGEALEMEPWSLLLLKRVAPERGSWRPFRAVV